MRQTKEEAAKTRQKLVDAGLKIFSSKGYSATKLEEIAREAGLTRGAIYWHFGSKLELYRTLVEESKTNIQKIVGEVLSTELTPLKKIRLMMIKIFVKLEEDKVFRAIEELSISKTERTHELEPVKREFSNLLHQTLELLTTLGEAGQAKGEIRSDINPKDLAWTVVSFFQGVISIWLNDQLRFSLSEKAETFVDIYLEGIVNK